MVEVGLDDLLVHLVAGVDEDREGLLAGEVEHGDEERGLVAADAVALGEGECDVVWLVAGRVVLDGDAHVADFLGDEGEDGADDVVLVGEFAGELGDLGLHFGRGLEVWLAEPPVPGGDVLPGVDG